jgi:hypothetical protein
MFVVVGYTPLPNMLAHAMAASSPAPTSLRSGSTCRRTDWWPCWRATRRASPCLNRLGVVRYCTPGWALLVAGPWWSMAERVYTPPVALQVAENQSCACPGIHIMGHVAKQQRPGIPPLPSVLRLSTPCSGEPRRPRSSRPRRKLRRRWRHKWMMILDYHVRDDAMQTSYAYFLPAMQGGRCIVHLHISSWRLTFLIYFNI